MDVSSGQLPAPHPIHDLSIFDAPYKLSTLLNDGKDHRKARPSQVKEKPISRKTAGNLKLKSITVNSRKVILASPDTILMPALRKPQILEKDHQQNNIEDKHSHKIKESNTQKEYSNIASATYFNSDQHSTFNCPFSPPSMDPVVQQQQYFPYQIIFSPQFISLNCNPIVFPNSEITKIRNRFHKANFDELMTDRSITVNPKMIQFIPEDAWSNEYLPFGFLVTTFFRKRNSMHCKFPNKIFNALKMSVFLPEFIPHIGVEWVTDSTIRVNPGAFARLLGVKSIESGLFHQNGNFPSHGFYELSFRESDHLSRLYGYGPVDMTKYRFVTHRSGNFRKNSVEADIETCKWIKTPQAI